jgi:DNA-binding NtrC family response regulator
MSRILVVDDKEMMRDSVATTLARKGHDVVAAAGGEAALKKLAERRMDAVVTDLQMPGMSGIDLLEEILRLDEQMPVVLMTAYGTVETAVSAMKRGAFDYITKPFSGDELQVAVERALEHSRLLRENQILKANRPVQERTPSNALDMMIGSEPIMLAAKERLVPVARSHGTVLITGESGTGKEVAARCIHALSPRAAAPLLAMNCAALTPTLLESELFGHEKGAFTGADRLRKGRFELADGGTLLLDEISEIPPEIQAKLLRVLQERTFERVGSSVSRSVDVRVIATTNRDLTAEVARGTFRQDLYYRLNVLPVAMPALRQHLGDLPDLVGHFLAQVARREGRPLRRMESEAIALLMSYAWPGNVRELQNICERAAVLAAGDVIPASLIAPWLTGPAGPLGAAPAPAGAVRPVGPPAKASALIEVAPLPGANPDCPTIVCNGRLTLEEIERQTIVATLTHNKGHRQRSARALGIGVRTLGLKLRKWKDLHLVPDSL